MAPETPHVRLANVSKTYNSHVVLTHTDLEVAPGEFVVIVGRSGSGKSTLLNLIGGLDFASSGEIWLLGQSLMELKEERRATIRCRSLGFVFQFFNLIPTLTVIENIRLPLALNGVSKEEAKILSGHLLHELGMAAFKIASADLTNVPLLRAAAGCGVPMLLSTGGSMFEEIREA